MDLTQTNKPARLVDRVREAIRVRQYSLSIEKSYVDWVKRFIIFHAKRHPAEMGKREVEAFLPFGCPEINVTLLP